MNYSGGKACATGANGVTDGASAAIYVYFIKRDVVRPDG